MIKAGGTWGRRRTAKALPCIEPDMMMITTVKDEDEPGTGFEPMT
jgi:hypothetical protein